MKTTGLHMLRIIPVSCWVICMMDSCAYSARTCRTLLEKSMLTNYDLVVVPGVSFDSIKWSYAMKGRVYWSKYLYDKGITNNVMYSGAAVYSPYFEAEIMALYAEKIGIPKDSIYTETLAEHSTENIYYSYQKARKLGFTKIALATDPFQARLLSRFTRKIVSPEVGIIPIVMDTLKAMQSIMIDPDIDYHRAFVEDFIPITDRENFFKRFKGTRGLDIDTTAYK